MMPPRFATAACPAGLLALLMLSAFASVPKLGTAPVIAAPDHFASARSLAAATSAAWPGSGWWQAYGDPQLDALIGEALVSSPDMDAAAARLRAAAVNRPAIVLRLLQRVQHEAGVRRPADAPAHDIAGVNVDHEGDVDEPYPGRDIGEV